MNNATVDIHIQLFVWINVFISLWCIPWGEMLGHVGGHVALCRRELSGMSWCCHSVCSATWLPPPSFHNPPQLSTRQPQPSTVQGPGQNFAIFQLCDLEQVTSLSLHFLFCKVAMKVKWGYLCKVLALVSGRQSTAAVSLLLASVSVPCKTCPVEALSPGWCGGWDCRVVVARTPVLGPQQDIRHSHPRLC